MLTVYLQRGKPPPQRSDLDIDTASGGEAPVLQSPGYDTKLPPPPEPLLIKMKYTYPNTLGV